MVGDLAGIKDQAFGEELVEEIVNHADGFTVLVYVPHQEPVVERRYQRLLIFYAKKAAGYPVERMQGVFVAGGVDMQVILL